MMTTEQTKLAEDNHNLIYAFLNKYNLKSDYYGDAGIGLCKAAMTYDKSKKFAFSTYAYKCMFNECGMTMRAEKIHNMAGVSQSLDEFISDDKSIKLEELLSDDYSHEHLSSIPHVLWFIDKMGIDDLKIILYMIQGYKQSEISDKTGRSRQMICKRVAYIRNCYKDDIRPEGKITKEKFAEQNKLKNKVIELLCA